jgi:hypothetical protein
MKRILSFVFCASFFFYGSIFAESANSKHSSELSESTYLTFDCGDTFDWGEIMFSKEPLKAEVKISNLTDDTVEIKRIKTSCGCTTSVLADSILLPGKSTTMSVELRVRNNPGQVSKSIYFIFDDYAKVRQTLHLSAVVNTGYDVLPKRMNFGKMILGKEKELSLKLVNTSNEKMTIESYDCLSPNMTVISEISGKTLLPEESIDILVKYVPDKSDFRDKSQETGYVNAKLSIYIQDHSFLEKIRIFGKGVIVPGEEE